MTVNTKITRTLVDDNGNKYSIGSDIAFDFQGHHYIINIVMINDTFIIGADIVKDKKPIDEIMVFKILEMNNCNTVSSGYC